MPGMVIKSEIDAIVAATKVLADREYRRGLTQGLGVAKMATYWLRGQKGGSLKAPYTFEQLAVMLEDTIAAEEAREK